MLAAVAACPASSHQLLALCWFSLGQEEVPEEEEGGEGLGWATWKQVLPPSLSHVRPLSPLSILFSLQLPKPLCGSSQSLSAGSSLPPGWPQSSEALP